MDFHTFNAADADRLDDVTRFRFCSRDELVAALDVDGDAAVADLGSGNGFYTDEVAPFVGDLYAVDVQRAMHERYRERGVPATVSPITADLGSLPLAANALDGAFSTMTFHEFATPDRLAALGRAMRPGARLVVADWTSEGRGERGPPRSERLDAERAADIAADGGFDVLEARSRPETLFVVAEWPEA
mgnify:CR=1 FL=1|jgi:SAM-dependent methyltransferase